MAIGQCHVVNANYERVLAVMDKFLQERYRDFCSCPRCMSDTAAIALNFLPPHYIVEKDGKTECGSPWVMVETAVTEAMDRVMEKPNHPRLRPQPEHSQSEKPDANTS